MNKLKKKFMRVLSLTLSLTLIMLIVATCRTVKTSESISTKVDSSTAADIKIKSEVNTNLTDKSKVFDSSTSHDTLSEVVTETEFSAPDSSGKQHVLKTKTTARNSGKRNINKITEQKNIYTRAKISEDIVDKSKTATITESDIESSKTVKKKTPVWIWLPGGIVALGLIVLAYLILKRFGLVK